MPDTDLQTRKTLRPVAGTPSELTVRELIEVWHSASLKYMLVGYVRSYLAVVAKEFKGETREYVLARAVADAKRWETDRGENNGNCSDLDEALEAARSWITTAAARPRGLDPRQHQDRRDALWDFSSVASASIVELVHEVEL